jgi:hypothetical protein
MSKRVLKTKLCDMLGIEYPILSAGMGPTLIGEKTGAPVSLSRKQAVLAFWGAADTQWMNSSKLFEKSKN